MFIIYSVFVFVCFKTKLVIFSYDVFSVKVHLHCSWLRFVLLCLIRLLVWH